MASRNLHLILNIFFSCGIASLLPAGLLAQQERIKVESTQVGYDSSIKKAVYRYPEFVKGKVVFKNGTYAISYLNHNIFNGEIEFIDPNQDTLALDEVHKIRSIHLGEDTYFYDEKGENLLILLEKFELSQLLVCEKYEVSNIKSKGPYGQEFNGVSPANSSRYYGNLGRLNQLATNSSFEFKVTSSYYFTDHNNRFLPVNKRNAYKAFDEHKDSVKEYIEENNIDFENEEEVRNLLLFFDELGKD